MRSHYGKGWASDAARRRGRPRIHVDVEAAREVLGDRLLRTPLLYSEALSRACEARVFLKAELFQKTGSFKPRGVLTKLSSLSPDEKRCGVIAASAGNHAAALAYGAALEDVDCLVVTWQGASPQKIAAARAFGASVDETSSGPEVVFERLAELQEESGRVLVHPFDDPLVIAGQGTVGSEVAEDLPEVDLVLVPTGGGGLVSGVAAALPGVRVAAVEPENSAALREGLAAGAPVRIRPASIADGLNAPFAGDIALEICHERNVETILVTEEEIRSAFRFLYEQAKLAAEPAGVAGVAALAAERMPEISGATIVAVVSGGNVSPEIASAILSGSEG